MNMLQARRTTIYNKFSNLSFEIISHSSEEAAHLLRKHWDHFAKSTEDLQYEEAMQKWRESILPPSVFPEPNRDDYVFQSDGIEISEPFCLARRHGAPTIYGLWGWDSKIPTYENEFRAEQLRLADLDLDTVR